MGDVSPGGAAGDRDIGRGLAVEDRQAIAEGGALDRGIRGETREQLRLVLVDRGRGLVAPFREFEPGLAYQVLLALADGERHGYGIVQDISQRTAARMTQEPGNLYRTLKWMLDHQLIEESDRRPAPELDDERRRYYRITRFGWRVGVAETARLEALVSEAKTKRWSRR